MKRLSVISFSLLVSLSAFAQSNPGTATTQPANIGKAAVVQGDSAVGAAPILGTGVPGTPSPGAPTLRITLPEKKKGTLKEGPAPSRPQ